MTNYAQIDGVNPIMRRLWHVAWVLVSLLGGESTLQAQAHQTSSITINGTEQLIAGQWNTGTVTVSVAGFSETVSYGQFSTPASIAAGLAAQFSEDPVWERPRLCTLGLCAKANGAVITFQAKAPLDLGPVTVSGTSSLTGASSSFGADTSSWIYGGTQSNTGVGQVAFEPAIIGAVNSGTPGYAGDGYPVTNASMDLPMGIVFDPGGNLYIADFENCQIRRIAPNGIITTVNTNNVLNGPVGLALDASGNLFILDESDPEDSSVSTIYELAASTGTIAALNINNGSLYVASGPAVDAAGNVYVTDGISNTLFRYNTAAGTTTTIAGGWASPNANGDGGPASAAGFYSPNGLTFDGFGNLYILDDRLVRVIYAAGTIPNVPNPVVGNIYHVAGNPGSDGYGGDGGPATAAELFETISITVDKAGDLYIGTYGAIRKVSAMTGIISTLAGDGNFGDGVPDGDGNGGSSLDAGIYYPAGLAIDPAGNFYIADTYVSTIREIGNHGSLNFGPQSVGTSSAAETVVVANRGNAQVTFTAPPAVTGDFSIASGSDCGTGTLGPGGSCQLSVVFTPTATGTRTGTITLTDDGVVTSQVLYMTGGVLQQQSTVYDYGIIGLTVAGPTTTFQVSVPYGEGSTLSGLSSSLAAAITGNPQSPVFAQQNSTSDGVVLTLKHPGSQTGFSYGVLAQTYDAYDFDTASFSLSPSSGNLTAGAPVGTTTIYSYSIKDSLGNSGYDGVGNVVAYNDSVNGQWSLAYDALDRLSGASMTSAATGGNAFYCWGFDSFGNRTTQLSSNEPFTGTLGSCQSTVGADVTGSPVTYTTLNQVNQSFVVGGVATNGYDAAGDVVYDGRSSYLYDPDGHVCAVSTPSYTGGVEMIQYIYDASGSRVAKGKILAWSCDQTTNGFAITNQYILGPGGVQMTELTVASGTTTPAWEHTNIYAGSTLVATYQNDDSGPHFRFSDWLGTMRAQTNYAGIPEQTCASLPFGDAPPCASATEQFFTGKERDAETGNDYFNARYLGSEVGRFTSPDPSGLALADIRNPQSFSLYTYVLNNPLISVDPTGLQECTLEGVAIDCQAFEHNEGAVQCPDNNCDPYFNFEQNRFTQFNPTEDDPSHEKDLTDPLVDPNVYDAATQGCLVDRINSVFQGQGLQVDLSSYGIQGGHAEFGLTPITSEDQLTNAGLHYVTGASGKPNGYRDNSLFMSVHVNGRGGVELGNLSANDPGSPADITSNAQAHFDYANYSAGTAGKILHSLVDVVIGTVLGGTSLDPRCP